MWKNNYPENDEVIIKVQNDRYRCSRDKLTHNSSYFEAMFGGSFKEKNEKLIDIKVRTKLLIIYKQFLCLTCLILLF